MTSGKIMLYHIHRKGIMDNLWSVGNNIVISDSFVSDFWTKSQKTDEFLIST